MQSGVSAIWCVHVDGVALWGTKYHLSDVKSPERSPTTLSRTEVGYRRRCNTTNRSVCRISMNFHQLNVHTHTHDTTVPPNSVWYIYTLQKLVAIRRYLRVTNVLFNPLIATLKPQSNGPSYSNTVIDTLAVDGWAVTFGTAKKGLSAQAPPRCTKCTAHPSTASVPTSYYSMRHCDYLCPLKG